MAIFSRLLSIHSVGSFRHPAIPTGRRERESLAASEWGIRDPFPKWFPNDKRWESQFQWCIFSWKIVFLWHWLRFVHPKTSIFTKIAAKTVAFSYCCLSTNLQLPVLSTTVFDVDMLPHFSSSSMQWLDVLNGTLQPSRRSCWVLLPLASRCFHPPSRPPHLWSWRDNWSHRLQSMEPRI